MDGVGDEARSWLKEIDDEDTDEEEVEKERVEKEEINEKINANTPCYQDAEARTISNKKHHYLKSQPQQKRRQLKPSEQHSRHRETPREELNRDRTPEDKGCTPGTQAME